MPQTLTRRQRIRATIREYRIVAGLAVASIITGIGGISGTSWLLNDEFEATPSGQAILQINIELVSNLFAIVAAVMFFVQKARRERAREEREAEKQQAELDAITERKMKRILLEIPKLVQTHADLAACIELPRRFIWERGAWDSGKAFLEDNLHHQPGLFYRLDGFYLAVEALREADRSRAEHLWHRDSLVGRLLHSRRSTRNIVASHLEHFTHALDALLPVLAKYGYELDQI